MSGNEITGIHNFFEENSSHQAQVAGSGCVVSSNNSRVVTHGMNKVASSSGRTDLDQRNGRLPIQTPLGIGLSQFSLKQHFDTSHNRNQQLNLNELMHASTTSHGRSGQAKFQGDGAIPNNFSSMQRGLANFGSQDGDSPSYASGFPGSLEKPDVQVSPVNCDFLRGHQQLSNQHPGVLQKQHLIAMHMQEIQRQQELQQLHLGARQHNSFNQIYGATGQGGVDEFSAMLSGMPVANAVNYMPVELMGFQSKSANNSHMINPANMNWSQRNMPVMPGIPNGLIYSQDQIQSMHSMGYMHRQLDESLHGTPVSGSMGPLNHYFQLQGISNDSSSVDLMSKLGENHAERTSIQSSVFNDFQNDQPTIPIEGYSGASFVEGRQGAQGKTSFGNTLAQDRNNSPVLGSIQQLSHLTEGVQVQEFTDEQRQNDWLCKSYESIAREVAPSNIGTSLDATEEKILFGVDDGANISLGGSNRVAGTYLNGYPMLNNDSLNVFPSLQSGTWSALVQEALEASSSDTGQQEEWSGLSLQKIEPQEENHFVLMNDSGKQNAVRDAESSLHISSSLRSKGFPFLNDAAASQSCHSVLGSQQAIKYTYEQNEKLEPDHSVQSVQQLPKENSDPQFTQNYQPYNFIGNSFEEGKQQLNARNGVWAIQGQQQAMHPTDSSEMGPSSRRMQHSWIHQQKMPFYNMNSQMTNKQSGWAAESPSSSGSRNFKTDENSDLNQYARSNEVNTTMHIEVTDARSLGKIDENRDADLFCPIGDSEPAKSEANNPKMSAERSYAATFADFMNPNSFRSNMVVNQQLLNKQPSHPLKHVAGHLFGKDKETNQSTDTKHLSAPLQDLDQTPGYTNNESSEAHDRAFSHLNTNHSSVNGQKESNDSLLARNDNFNLTGSCQKVLDQSDQKSLGSRRFQFHPMGNLEIYMEPANHESNKSHSQGIAHPMTWGLKNHEKEKFGSSHLVEPVSSSSHVDVGKDCYMDSKKSSALAEISRTGTFYGHNPAVPSFSATAHYTHEKRIGVPSQNVPMLFGKVHQSDDSSSAAKLDPSENISSGIRDGIASDGLISSHLQHNLANPLQVSGLNLAHSSQRPSTVGNSLTGHTSAEDTYRAWSSSTTSTVVLPTIHEASQSENMDYKTVRPPHSSMDASHSVTKGNLSGMPNTRNQPLVQQKQQNVSSSRQAHFEQSVNYSYGNKVGVDSLPKHHHAVAQGPHVGSPTNQSSQAFFPGMPGKIPDSRLDSFSDCGATTHSPFYSRDASNSEIMDASSDQRNISQLHQDVETVSANEPSAATIASQQGHYTNIFNNVWRSASSHWPSGLQPQKFATNLLQSLNHSQPPHQDDQRSNRGNSSTVGTCSANPQQFTHVQDNALKGASSEQKHAMGTDVSLRVASPMMQGQESKNPSDKSSAVSVSPSVRLHLLDNKKVKHADKQRENVDFTTASPSNNYVQKHNYSLLQQMQSMKGIHSDPNKVAGNRLKVIDSGCEELDAGSQPENAKRLGFSSREIEEKNGFPSTHLVVGELASCKTASSSGHHELQNNSLSSSLFNLTGINERHPINPQMAPSWFDQCETYKDSQTSGMSDSLGSCQRSAKAAAQNFLFSKTCEQLDDDTLLKRSSDNISENSSPIAVAADSHSSHQKLRVCDESLVPAKKKRKLARLDLLPWHNEVTQSPGSWRSFSISKMKWAQATNRLIEKIEDDAETVGGVPSIILSGKRLILTTQLMQHIFPPVPAKLLFEDSVMSYEKVIYYLAKLSLGEVCSAVSTLRSDSGLRLESKSKSMVSEKHNTPRKMREEFFSNIVENFIMRLRKLQNISCRLDGGYSIVDYRMELQDLERVSIINRFAKFHGRGPIEGAEGSTASETSYQRNFPQRMVTMLPMPRSIPDAVNCLSL